MYSRLVKDKELTFGVSGLLYRSNVLMYDHQSESLWSQVMREAVTGLMTGARLTVLPSTITRWNKWKKRYPSSQVLSLNTGYRRDYGSDPYEDYYKRKTGLFSFFRPGPGEKEKELVAGISIDGQTRAYPVEYIRHRKIVHDRLGKRDIEISYDPADDLITARDGRGKEIPHITVYWFVWKGIHPGSDLFQADNE